MVGLAGIGYQLLRLAAPEKVPSVLLLAPPLEERLRNSERDAKLFESQSRQNLSHTSLPLSINGHGHQ